MTKRTILISGTSKGIGHALSEMLLKDGHRVIGISRTSSNSLNEIDGYTEFLCDLSDEQKLHETMKDITRAYPQLDALVCNAGAGRFGGVEEFSPEQIAHSLRLNLLNPVLLTRFCLPILQKHSSSDVIFIGSESALKGGKRGTLYSASKFGVRGFAQALRQEVSGRGVRVSMIHPGMVRTSFFDELDFEPGPNEAHVVELGDLCKAVKMVLDAAPSTVFEEIVVRPLKHVIAKKR